MRLKSMSYSIFSSIKQSTKMTSGCDVTDETPTAIQKKHTRFSRESTKTQKYKWATPRMSSFSIVNTQAPTVKWTSSAPISIPFTATATSSMRDGIRVKVTSRPRSEQVGVTDWSLCWILSRMNMWRKCHKAQARVCSSVRRTECPFRPMRVFSPCRDR